MGKSICGPEPLSAKEQEELDKEGRLEAKEFHRPPQGIRQSLELSRKEVKNYRSKFNAKMREKNKAAVTKSRMGRSKTFHHPELHAILTLEDRIKNDVRRTLSLRDQNDLGHKPLPKLAPYLKRFDWRRYNVVPKVRKQEGHTCWALVATEAFESSFMIERENFSIKSGNGYAFPIEQVMLNVNSTFDHVRGGGRHETVFRHWVESGLPLQEISFKDFEKRDIELNAESIQRSKRIKAIAWNYVLRNQWRTPTTEDEIRELKEALLEFGPLAVMVSSGGGFRSYGCVENAVTVASPGTRLRFPPRTVTFKRDEIKNKLFLNLQGLGNREWDKETDDVTVRFPADKAPILEQQTENPANGSPTRRDDAVTFDIVTGELGFTVNNAVTIEKDDRTDQVVLQFPADTDARFTTDPATRDLIVCFPADTAPVFASNKGEVANHVVLLIGWDEGKCAWIIQNTYFPWGYQCNGPNLGRFDSESGTVATVIEDRGYMYIRYGCNQIGRWAAWIQAPLLKHRLWGKKQKK